MIDGPMTPAVPQNSGDRRDVEPLALETIELTKRFGDLVANQSISMGVRRGGIHAVVGENGAGKTTLMRMVYGLYTPDSGRIRIAGQDRVFRSPRDALAAGVAMVHQTSLLVDSLTVTENIMLSLSGQTRRGRREVLGRLSALSDEHGLGLDPRLPVAELSVGMRQRAEILGALYHEASVLILDEPTTVLTPSEADKLFSVLRTLSRNGTAVLLVTHKLREVLAVTEGVTVLRSGVVVGEERTENLDERALVQMMVGRSVPTQLDEIARKPATTGRPAALVLHELAVTDRFGTRRLDGVDLTLLPGEIVAVTGVEGNGQRELVQAVMGTGRASGGSVHIGGSNVTRASVGRRRRLGLGYIPESRPTEGLAADLSLEDNLVLGDHARPPYARWGLRRMRPTHQFARQQIADFAIAARSPREPVGNLSGGNAQKVVVAREVTRRPRVLLAVQPTQGVDVAAAYAIRSMLAELRSQDVGVLLVTSDLREACDLADRAVVLYNGAVAGELARADLTEESIGALAMGVAT